MLVKKTETGTMAIVRDSDREEIVYSVGIGMNGKKYVKKDSVPCNYLHISEGNDKTGDALNFNFPIEYTCDHHCECYKSAICYACKGCYTFGSNQQQYTENLNFFTNNASDEFCKAVQLVIDSTDYSLFRWFTCGDIVNKRFFECMVAIAANNPNVSFWAYTKKYSIVNSWIDEIGLEYMPHNLTIIFSHWLNSDGTYFPMNNPYNLPTSEFIPIGKEELTETVTHVCPCSNPNVVANCANCDHPCYKLGFGQSMALQEHSTKETKARDKALRESKKAIKEAEKASKKRK